MDCLQKNRIWKNAALLGLIILLGVAGMARAQVASKVEYELEKTDRLIETATQIVHESGDEQALQYLERALYLQQIAWEKFAAAQVQEAMRFTLQARLNAERAIGKVRGGDESRALVLRELERTDEIIRMARESMDIHVQSQRQTILEKAEAAQVRAWELFYEGRQKMALTATLRARNLVERGVETTPEEASAGREIDKTEMLIDRTHELLANLQIAELPPEVRNGIRIQEQAREALSEGDYKQALKLTMQAREQIQNALARIEKDVQTRNFSNLLDQLQARYDRLQGLQSEAKNKAAGIYLERAQTEMSLASERYAAGQIDKASYHLRRANHFIEQAAEILD